MKLVDSQIHLWVNAESAARMMQTFMAVGDILAEMDTVGVERTYLVPGHTAANTMCVEAALRWPDRFRALALLALDKPDSRAVMANWSASGFIGVRLTFPPYRAVSWLDDGTADWFWPMAERLGLPVMVWAPLRAATIGELARRFPRIRFIVDHINLYVLDKGDAVSSAVEAVLALASEPNVAVKVSSLPAHSDAAYPYRDMHGHVRRVVDAFGADRALWGTDLTRRSCSYAQAIAMFTKEMPFLSEAQLESIMGGTATRWMGWQRSTQP